MSNEMSEYAEPAHRHVSCGPVVWSVLGFLIGVLAGFVVEEANIQYGEPLELTGVPNIETGTATLYGNAYGYGRWLETKHVLEIVRQGRVYLAPLEAKDGQWIHDCIFIGTSESDPLLEVGEGGVILSNNLFWDTVVPQ